MGYYQGVYANDIPQGGEPVQTTSRVQQDIALTSEKKGETERESSPVLC